MMQGPLLSSSIDEWIDEFIASDELVGRLYRANEDEIRQLIAPLPPHRRAGLAAFCYRRSHLHAIGLTIAATCEQSTLMQVLGTAVGTVLFTQSRSRKPAPDRLVGGHRLKITLARVKFDAPPTEADANELFDEIDASSGIDDRASELAG